MASFNRNITATYVDMALTEDTSTYLNNVGQGDIEIIIDTTAPTAAAVGIKLGAKNGITVLLDFGEFLYARHKDGTGVLAGVE